MVLTQWFSFPKESIIEQKLAASAASGGSYANRTLLTFELRRFGARCKIWCNLWCNLYFFLSKGLTWYVYLKVLARVVNHILYLHEKYQKCGSKVWTHHFSAWIKYIYLYRNCRDSFVLFSSNVENQN